MTDITWENPPPLEEPAPREVKYSEVAAALRANPEIWAVVVEDGWAAMEHAIRKGSLAAFRPAGAFEARVVRAGTTQRGKVYARFMGDPEPDLAPAPEAEPNLESAEPTAYEAKIRSDERERVARRLEGHRQESGYGSLRRVSNFSYAAQFVRSLR